MNRLKRRKPMDVLQTEVRRRQVSRGRWVYLGIIVLAALYAIDALFGSSLYLKSDGLVVARPHTVATEFTATVRNMVVEEGQWVEKGQVLVQVSSQDITEKIADLALRVASSRARLAEFRVRAGVAKELTNAARERRKVDKEAKKNLSNLFDRGLVTAKRHAEAVREAYRSLADERLLVAETRATRAQLESLTKALQSAEDAFKEMVEAYGGGIINAPVSGIVTAVRATEGSVVRAGQHLLEIQSGPRRVMGYLPTGTLYSIGPGEEVVVRCGVSEFPARIASIQPMAVALPEEFQRRFQPVERAQIAIIDFEDASGAPPLFTKVAVRSTLWPLTWMSSLFGTVAGSACSGARPSSEVTRAVEQRDPLP